MGPSSSGTLYDRSRNRWAGTITVGWKPDGRRDRIIVRGKTKTEVKDKLRTKHQELAAGIRAPARYTVEQCLNDWLETLSTQAENTVTGYRIMVRHLVGLLGSVKLVELKVRDVDFALGKLAKRLSTRSVRLARMILIQAIRNAMVNDLVVRNVADLAAVPTGRAGRPSRSLNLEQALAVLDTAKGERLWPYVAVSMLGGIRTEEARALRWSEVDLEAGTVAVYRSVRRTGKTKTLRFAPVGFWRTHRADRGRGGPFEHPDNRGRVQAPAPPGYAYRCRRARSAVREQRQDRRRPKLNR
jgi:integrase